MIKLNMLRRIGGTLRWSGLLRPMNMAGNPVLRGSRRDFDDLTQTADLDHLRAEMNPLKRKHPLSSLGGAPAPINDRSPRG